MSKKVYRPEWTCGRYDENTHSAIYYNLLEGVAYSFEDESADVIGCVISAGRNNEVIMSDVASATGICESSIEHFFDELESLSLLIPQLPTEENIARYRSQISLWRKANGGVGERTITDKLPFETSTAELDYSKRVGGISSIMLELTYRCSEKCIHCYNPGAARNDEEHSHRASFDQMSLDDYKRVIDELYAEGLSRVCLTGGDPFSNKDVWDIIEYLYSKDIAITIYTNGLSIVDKVDRLSKYYPRVVGVSIYSGDSKEHDIITRIPGSWAKSMAVVEKLSELAVPTNLKCCVMRPNLKHYYEVADLAKKYGAVPQFEVSVTDSVEGDLCVSKYLRLSPEQMKIVLRDENIPLYVGKEAPNYGGQKRAMDAGPCGAGENSFCLTPSGDLIPCCSFHLVLGNVLNESVKDILSNSSELHKWRGFKLSDSEECGRYDYCDYCYLCPGSNFSLRGDYKKASENNCWLAKVRYNLAMKMMSGYDPLANESLGSRLSKEPDVEMPYIHRVK